MQMRLDPRFDYGRLVPAMGRIDQGMFAVAGPDAVCLRTPVEIGAAGGTVSASFTVSAGDGSRFISRGIPRTPLVPGRSMR